MSKSQPDTVLPLQKKAPVEPLAIDAEGALDSIREILLGDAQRRAESDARSREESLHARLDDLERSLVARVERLQDELTGEIAARVEQQRAFEEERDRRARAHEARWLETERAIASSSAAATGRGALADMLTRMADELRVSAEPAPDADREPR